MPEAILSTITNPSTDPSAPPKSEINPTSKSDKLIFAPTSDPNKTTAEQYNLSTLSRSSLLPNPLSQFHSWFESAKTSSVHQPETVCLSTSHLPSGRVSSRYVYLKELDKRGFVIYSNFDTSHKQQDLETNSHASLAFWWREVERQVRVEGKTERLSREESQVYFNTRGRESRIGAWASKQSAVIKDRDVLDGWVRDVEETFKGQEEIPVPEFWGGLRIIPEMIEFWQGRNSRLHDRFKYTKQDDQSGKDTTWKIERLSP